MCVYCKMITVVSLVAWDDKFLVRTFKTCFCSCKHHPGYYVPMSSCFITGSFVPPWGRIIFYCVAGPHFCLSAYQLMDTWVVPTFWLLWIALWTWVCMVSIVSPNLNSLGVELHGLMVNSIFNFTRNLPIALRSGCTILHSHWQHTDKGRCFSAAASAVIFWFSERLGVGTALWC